MPRHAMSQFSIFFRMSKQEAARTSTRRLRLEWGTQINWISEFAFADLPDICVFDGHRFLLSLPMAAGRNGLHHLLDPRSAL